MKKKYAQVIVDNRATSTDRPYTYIIEPNMLDELQEGMRVLVPFGKGNRILKGIVISIDEDYNKKYKLKSIIDIIDDKPLIPKDLIELSLWMSKEYLSPYVATFQVVLPPGDFKEVQTIVTVKDVPNLYYKQLNSLEKDIIDLIKTKDNNIKLEMIRESIQSPKINSAIKSLEHKGLIETRLEIETFVDKKYEKYVTLKDSSISYEYMANIIGNRSYKQLEIAEYLLSIKNNEISLKELMENTNSSLSTVKALEKKGIIYIYNKEIYRTPIEENIHPYKKQSLTWKQRNCVDTIIKDINTKDKENKFLIHGVTGSGKTEVYLHLVEEMIKQGKESIVLVPEIALTPQTIERFVGRFGNNIAVLHSKLSQGERFDQWRKIKEGKVKIAVGARSAIFAPFSNLGLIIIDEEHEATYKSSMNPKYHAIEVAEKRCEQTGASLVLGTATPSIDSYYRARNGELKLLSLDERVNSSKMPEVNIIDMREELNQGNKSIFSRELYQAIDKNLKEGKQTILFLNRRGYSTFVSCRQCGYVVKCNSCDIAMTYHMKDNKLKCHYCGLAIKPPSICPVCRSKYIKYFGIGTEKVENHTKRMFPKAKVQRMDMDTTTKKGSYESIFKDMNKEKIDILIGTQMVAKGLDFKNVTLVGIIAADTSLNLPDFRAPERTFQLITQVSGRAGRGDYDGKVIVQTYTPEHYSIECAKNHDYISFYNKEILLREEFKYPPFINIISIVIYGENLKLVAKRSKEVYKNLLGKIFDIGHLDLKENVIGPYPAPLEKIKKNYRYQILIKCRDEQLEELKNVVDWVCIKNKAKLDYQGIKFNIDINPNSIM